MISESLYNLINFDIDRYLNPYILRNHLYLLPKPISHFLGWRDHPSKDPPATVQWALTVLSTVGGLLVVGAVYNYAPGVKSWNPPPMIASLGAAAILEYNAVRSPFAQPRNTIVGHTLAAIVAVGVAKLFMLAPEFNEKYGWIASIVACAAASLVMSMTNTVHPPGGAAAVLACTDTTIIALGWMFPALILLGSVLMMLVAFIFNNTLRQYPIYWWTPNEVGSKLYRRDQNEHDDGKQVDDSDAERGDLHPSSSVSKVDVRDETNSERTLSPDDTHLQFQTDEVEVVQGLEAIHIAPYMIRMPSKVSLTDAEAQTLRGLMLRLRTNLAIN